LTKAALRRTRSLVLSLVVAVGFLGGCATTAHDPRDPLEPVNRAIYTFNEHVDGLVLKPAAELYRLVLPSFVRTGVGNFFSNLGDVIVALNNLLQGKVSNAASDASRVAVNSTIGVLGFIDVASRIGLPKHDEDFGQTLGWWGMGDGPYLVLPLLGPSNFRDAVGRVGDFYVDPVTYVDPTRARNQLWGTRVVSTRADLLGASRVLEAAALDPYVFVRDAYLQRRRNLIYDGNPPREDFDDDSDIKKEPPRKPQARARIAAEPEEPIRSVLVSGEPLTPAEEEARSPGRPPLADAAVMSSTRFGGAPAH
jgi:phospholipid-binding lipoprotein MlaA